VRLLEWLSGTAFDADDECVAIGERHFGTGFLDEDREMRALRDLGPAIFSAVHPLLSHDDADVRDAALVAVIPPQSTPPSPHTGPSWSTTPAVHWPPAPTATIETASWTP
jgi:hypothetical protein